MSMAAHLTSSGTPDTLPGAAPVTDLRKDPTATPFAPVYRPPRANPRSSRLATRAGNAASEGWRFTRAMPPIRPLRALTLGLVLLLAVPGVAARAGAAAPHARLGAALLGDLGHDPASRSDGGRGLRHQRLAVPDRPRPRPGRQPGRRQPRRRSEGQPGSRASSPATVGSTSVSRSRRPPSTASASSPTTASSTPRSCPPEGGRPHGRSGIAVSADASGPDPGW